MNRLPFIFLVPAFMYLLNSCAPAGSATYSPTKRYDPALLKEDARKMEYLLRKNHPSLHWFTNPKQLDSAFNHLYKQLDTPLTETAFRNLINQTIGIIRCGHTSARPSKNYSWYTDVLPPSGFPLGLKPLDDSTLIITSNLYRSDSLLVRGAEILSVNNRSARLLIDTLACLIPSDGLARNFSLQNLSNQFARFYNARFPQDSVFEIVYKDYEGVIHQIRRYPYTRAGDTLSSPKGTSKPLKSKFQPKKIPQSNYRSFMVDSKNRYAVLKINTFTRHLHRSFLRQSFKQLKKDSIPALILDLRINGGGLIRSSLLLAKYIHTKPFRFTDSIISPYRKISGKGKISRRQLVNLGMWMLSKKNKGGNGYRFRYFQRSTYKPHKNYYNGRVFVLTGGYSFSATSMFLASVKGNSQVTLVGEETGGGWYGNSGGFIPEITLPHTKIRVRLPLYRIVNDHLLPLNGSGVLPDIEIKPNRNDIRANEDPKMKKALELIHQSGHSSSRINEK